MGLQVTLVVLAVPVAGAPGVVVGVAVTNALKPMNSLEVPLSRRVFLFSFMLVDFVGALLNDGLVWKRCKCKKREGTFVLLSSMCGR